MERDIRALSPELSKVEAQALGLAAKNSILEKENINELNNFSEIVLSNDEVGRALAGKYLQDKKLTWDTAFLRWNQMNAVTKVPLESGRNIASSEFDKKIIALARKEAEKSSDWWRHVGAVLIKDGKVISSRYNKHAVTENTAYIEVEPRSNFNSGKDIAELVIFEHGETH